MTASTSQQARIDDTGSERAALIDRLTRTVGAKDATMILRRVVALAEAGEPSMPIAARLNGPARVARKPLDVVPFDGHLGATTVPTRHRHTNDADLAAELRVQREIDRVNRKPKVPPVQPAPKVEPKPRPVKRTPVPQRKGSSTRPGGVVLRVETDGDGSRWRVGTCGSCSAEFRHPMQRGRFPLACEACR